MKVEEVKVDTKSVKKSRSLSKDDTAAGKKPKNSTKKKKSKKDKSQKNEDLKSDDVIGKFKQLKIIHIISQMCLKCLHQYFNCIIT
jgi:hypothetical protein